eukprot:7242667-Heterocapsa_arctica.AAC.1
METLALVIGVKTYGELIRAGQLTLCVRSDSTKALATGGQTKFSYPVLNFLAAELGIALEI